MEPGDLGLDLLRPDRPLRGQSLGPGVEPRAGNLQEAGHPRDRVVALLRVISANASRSYPMLPGRRRATLFFKNARSIFSSEFSLRSRASSADRARLRAPSRASWRDLCRPPTDPASVP